MSTPAPARGRFLIPALLALLAAVALIHLLVGLPEFLLYGLAGGLIFCLLIAGRDRLLTAQRQLDREREARRKDVEGTEGRREDRE